jgi:hypothetical protein
LLTGAGNLALVDQGPHHAHEFLAVACQVERFELEVTFDSGPQGRQAEQVTHEADLIENGFEEEPTEGCQSGV